MQFDVYENKQPETRQRFPYLLDVQADLLDSLDTLVVIPLAPKAAARRALLAQLMPVVRVKNRDFLAYTPQLAGLARSKLGPRVANLAEAREAIISALDLLLTGV